jgi:hypothetical protein
MLRKITEQNAPSVRKVKELPRENGRVVLAHGEVTGHSHAFGPEAKVTIFSFENAAADTLAQGGSQSLAPRRFIEVLDTEALLQHEEHTAIPVPKGLYEVIIQREYHQEEIRQVHD